jgi:hypothetical protein
LQFEDLSRTLTQTLTLFLFGFLFSQNALAQQPPQWPADVLGRNLNFSTTLASVGHVGLWAQDTQVVIEALDEPGVIKVNSINDFVSRAGVNQYWGARRVPIAAGSTPAWWYGWPTINNYWERTAIVRTANTQRGLPSRYTLSTDILEGSFTQTCVSRDSLGNCTAATITYKPAMFRCDTFVQWAYAKTGYPIYYSGVRYPSRLFSFLSNGAYFY